MKHMTATESIAIIGAGCSRLEGKRGDVSLQELIFEGASAALADANLKREQIDSVVLSASDLVDGRGIANMSSAAAAGAYMKHETRTTNDGLYALIMACLQILSGRSQIALVVAWNKISEVQWEAASPAFFEPFYERPVGLDEWKLLGLSAASLMQRDPGARKRFDEVLLRNSRKASEVLGTRCLEQRDIDESPYVAWPLKEVDFPVPTDGTAALVVASGEIATKISQRPVFVNGFFWATAAAVGNRRLEDSSAIAAVAKRAYREANIHSLDDIELIELVAKSSAEEGLILDGLVSPLGGEARDLFEGTSASGGRRPEVNPSGGATGIYLGQAAGLFAASQATRQIRGTGGLPSMDKSKVAVVHSQSGPALQNNAVVVLSSSKRGIA